jgi:hypothetical protein
MTFATWSAVWASSTSKAETEGRIWWLHGPTIIDELRLGGEHPPAGRPHRRSIHCAPERAQVTGHSQPKNSPSPQLHQYRPRHEAESSPKCHDLGAGQSGPLPWEAHDDGEHRHARR